MYDFESFNVISTLERLLTPDCDIHTCHPFGDLCGPSHFYKNIYHDLLNAIPDLERRDYIRISGPSETGEQWVRCAGFYTGVFTHTWMGVKPTGHLVTLRFHEFFRVENNRIEEIQAIWDIPDWLRQAHAWPMATQPG